jgi:hypothetical protein
LKGPCLVQSEIMAGCLREFIKSCWSGNIAEIDELLDSGVDIGGEDFNRCWCGCSERVSFIEEMMNFPVATLEHLIQREIITPNMTEVPGSSLNRVYRGEGRKINGSGMLWTVFRLIYNNFYRHKYHDEELLCEFEPEPEYTNEDIREHNHYRESFDSLRYLIAYLMENAPELLHGLKGDPQYDDDEYDERICLIESVIRNSFADEQCRTILYMDLVEAGVNPFAHQNLQYLLPMCLRGGHIDIGNHLISLSDYDEVMEIVNSQDDDDNDSGSGGFLLQNLNYIIGYIYDHRHEEESWACYWTNRDLKHANWLIDIGIDLDKTDDNDMSLGDYVAMLRELCDGVFPFEDTEFYQTVVGLGVVARHSMEDIRRCWAPSTALMREALRDNDWKTVESMMKRDYDVLETDDDGKTVFDYMFEYPDNGLCTDYIIKKIDFDNAETCQKLFQVCLGVARTGMFYHYPEDIEFNHWAVMGGGDDGAPDPADYMEGVEEFYQANHYGSSIRMYKDTYTLLADVIWRLSSANLDLYGKDSNPRQELLQVLQNNQRIRESTVARIERINGGYVPPPV